MTQRLLLTLALVASAAHADQFKRFQRNSRRPSPAFFEFAPASGAGLGAPCACAAVTGAKGETVTWSRGSSAMCTKSASETSIANGDLVLCASNQPRVMSLGGPLGVLVESSRTNGNLQSEVSSNAVYTNTATVTDDTTTSPRNDLTADTLTDSSGVATQSSCQTISTTSATQQTFSVYLAAGTLSDATVTMTGTGSSTGDCSRAYSGLPSGSWTRGSCTSPAAYAGTLTAVTVCVTVGAAAVNTGSVIVWGRQWEIGAYATSYIPTTTVAVTRSADANSVPSVPVDTAGCVAATVTPLWSGSNGPANPMVVGSNASRYLYLRSNGFNQWASFDATTDITVSEAWTGFSSYRAVSTWTGATHVVKNVTRATSNSGAFDGTMGAPAFSLGADATLGQVDAIVSRVQLDPTPGVCQ